MKEVTWEQAWEIAKPFLRLRRKADKRRGWTSDNGGRLAFDTYEESLNNYQTRCVCGALTPIIKRRFACVCGSVKCSHDPRYLAFRKFIAQDWEGFTAAGTEILKSSTFHQVPDWRTLKQVGPRKRLARGLGHDPMVTQQTRDRISAAVKQEGGYVETERAFNDFIAPVDDANCRAKLHHGNPDQLVFNLDTKKFYYREIKDHGAPIRSEQRAMFEALEALGITVEVWERDAPTVRKVAA
jgi:hypothetical protein